jgi:hypothetical protein
VGVAMRSRGSCAIVAGMRIETRIGVELRGAAKTYRNPGRLVHAVRGIDVSITRGETVALLGPNGAGKSTTIDMLLSLVAPDSGTVSLLDGPPKHAVAHGLVGAMLQAGALMRDVKVRELIAMMAALHPYPLDVDEALELAGLADIAGRRTHKLSGGQAQRVRFAIALVPNPAAPLSGGGRRRRRPCGPDVPGPRRRRRTDGRDQGSGGDPDDPRHGAGRRSEQPDFAAGRRRSRSPRRRDRPDLQ